MTPAYDDDEHYIEGAHGTIAEQKDEAYYDDRSDADDDMEKGRIRFPNNILYGRERELEILGNIYGELASSTNGANGSNLGEKKIAAVSEEKEEEPSVEQELAASSDSFKGSRVVFLSGYSGIGKSALVKEFVKQIQCKYQSSDASPILHASGKYTEQSTASVPFSAIAEVLERLALNLSREDKNEKGHDMLTKVVSKIRESDLIGPGRKGNLISRATFTTLAPLLDHADDPTQLGKSEDGSNSTMHHSMNAIKECTHEILSVICETLDYPLVLFLDDLQWGDGASIEMLSFLLSSTKLRNIMLICAYRSNEVDADHSFTKLMENVTQTRNDSNFTTLPKSVARMNLFSLSPEAITKYIAEAVKQEEAEGVAELAEAVYAKTMGNIFFVMQALEELVRKNILFYDVMCFEWRWVVSKVELANYMSDDVVATVKGKMRELSVDIQNLLVVMAFIPNMLDVSILKVLMSHGEFSFEESTITELLKEASDEGMLIFSTEGKNYTFAHDRIRQASLEFAAEQDQDELLLHISQVLLDFARGPEMEWCLYVAVDLLNSLPPDKTNCADLIKLNVRVSKIARSRGSIGKENELLHKALKCLESSGIMWKEYGLTLEIYNSVIVSEHSLGSYDMANEAIDKVIKNAKTINDKLQAYVHQMLCKGEETSDFSQGAEDGVRTLNLYGFDIPTTITNTYMVKEGMKLKIALRSRSYSCLAKLPLKDDPLFWLIYQVQRYATFSSKGKLATILAWKAIRCAIKQGMGRHLPIIMVGLAKSLADQGNVRTAQEIGNVSLALAEKIHEDTEVCASARSMAYAAITQLRSFRTFVEPILQCHKDLKLVGAYADAVLGSGLIYFQTFLAAGLELDPLLESKLLHIEELCRNIGRLGFLTTFQVSRQFSLNLRIRTENPTEFQGEAFREEEALSKMNSKARKMALRDSSSFRLQLAFVFWNEDTMTQMLKRLVDYPLKDPLVARLHNRLCFTGLAAFALGKREGCESFLKLGQNCLSHFGHLTKHGSVNAKPVYLFMLAMKGPSREAFKKAIDACAEANMIHLEAMANERYASFLSNEKDTALANDYITSSYWLYQEWGAQAKALKLSQQYVFLKHSKRKGATSLTLSNATSDKSLTFFNTTFKSSKKILANR